ncbi:MAG: hypothetical protein JWM55_195 [Acidimicrobiaceae bacterium]|nr:hypothetical protein [Acidimicrobiaceae bacterium]
MDVIVEQIFVEFLGSDRQIETEIEPLIGEALERGFLRRTLQCSLLTSQRSLQHEASTLL